MKVIRLAAILLLFVSSSAFTHAQVPDGGIAVKHTTNSTAVTSMSGPLTFTACSPTPSDPDAAADCTLFGGAQAVFAGINESPNAWNALDLVFKGYDPQTDPSLGCFGNTVFSICSIAPGADCTATSTSCTLDVDFSQGTGTGIQCDITNPNHLCAANTALNIINNFIPGNPILPYDGLCNGIALPPPAGAVCGSDHFGLGVGGTNDGIPIDFEKELSNDVSFVANPTPEPPTLFLFGVALLGIVFFATKKRVLA